MRSIASDVTSTSIVVAREQKKKKQFEKKYLSRGKKRREERSDLKSNTNAKMSSAYLRLRVLWI
jgi:hypothetical protein